MSRLSLPASTYKGSKQARLRSRIAVAARTGTPEQVAAAKRDHAAQRIEDYARQVAVSLPPLTDEQIGRIVALLRPAPAGGVPRDAA